MGIIVTILIFGLIIFVHELGHFLVAKWCGVLIHEFSLGMGPTIFKRKKGETTYSLRLFPIGGFVKMEGEDSESVDNRAFCKKPLYQRFFIVVAGAFMNLLLGLIIILVFNSFQSDFYTTKITSFKQTNFSQSSGLRQNDVILKVDNRSIYIVNDLLFNLSFAKNEKADFEVKRNGQKITVKDVSFLTKINNQEKLIFNLEKTKNNPIVTIQQTFLKTASISKIIVNSLFDLITGRVSTNELSGPIGVAKVVSTATSQSIESTFGILIFLTINIGIFNLLPLPALDGGRLLFMLIELVRGKPVPPKYEGVVHFVGFALLMVLIVFVIYNDIMKLVKGVI